MKTFRRFRSLAGSITLVSILVALIAIVVIGVGVLVISQDTFEKLMIEAGRPATEAQAMFDHAVTNVFLVAVLIAIAISILLAIFLADRLAKPLRQLARAAERIASGDYEARVPNTGPAELASLAESFNRMAAGLADQERQRNDFIANAAHELRTPLTNLQGYLEALRDGVIAPTPEQFGSLHEEAQRLVRLSRSLDALVDAELAPQDQGDGDVDMAQAVRSALEIARPAFDAKQIEVRVSTPESLIVRAEPDRVAQVLANLLQNACRYTPVGGRTTIEVAGERSHVLVSVTNTGDGIPATELPHVFERFYRVEKSRDATRGGAGIGLAIVKQLVEALGGRVGATSDGRSTQFWFSLPSA